MAKFNLVFERMVLHPLAIDFDHLGLQGDLL